MVSEPEDKKRRLPRERRRDGEHDHDASRIIAELEPILSDTLHLFRSLAREDYKVWYKAEDDPVTEVDIQLDRYLKHRLLEGWPDYGWLSEETADDRRRLGKRRTWIVDPLDGTRQFVAGVPEYACSIALEEAGSVVASAVIMLATGDRYTAARGAGAFKNGRPLAVAKNGVDAAPPVLVSRREHGLGRFEGWSLPEGLSLQPVGGMACKLVRVAEGQATGTFTADMRYEWDVAGAALLVEEAGGRVTDARGLPLSFNTSYVRHAGVVASAEGRHDAVLALCRQSEGAPEA